MWLSDYNGSSFWQVICHFSIECFGAGKGAISQWMVARHIGEKKNQNSSIGAINSNGCFRQLVHQLSPLWILVMMAKHLTWEYHTWDTDSVTNHAANSQIELMNGWAIGWPNEQLRPISKTNRWIHFQRIRCLSTIFQSGTSNTDTHMAFHMQQSVLLVCGRCVLQLIA